MRSDTVPVMRVPPAIYKEAKMLQDKLKQAGRFKPLWQCVEEVVRKERRNDNPFRSFRL